MRAVVAELGSGPLKEVLREGIGLENGADLDSLVERVCPLPALPRKIIFPELFSCFCESQGDSSLVCNHNSLREDTSFTCDAWQCLLRLL